MVLPGEQSETGEGPENEPDGGGAEAEDPETSLTPTHH